MEERILGTNNTMSSSIVMLSYLQYSNAYELDYSSHVIIYELAIRDKLRWWFIVPSGVPNFFTCRSVGSETRGNLGSFFVCKHGAWVWRNM